MVRKILTLLLIVAAGTSVSAQTAVGDSLKMDSLVRSLPEVMIKGERPMVKVKGAALVYDIDRITEGSPVDNAYDALKEIPGVWRRAEALRWAEGKLPL